MNHPDTHFNIQSPKRQSIDPGGTNDEIPNSGGGANHDDEPKLNVNQNNNSHNRNLLKRLKNIFSGCFKRNNWNWNMETYTIVLVFWKKKYLDKDAKSGIAMVLSVVRWEVCEIGCVLVFYLKKCVFMTQWWRSNVYVKTSLGSVIKWKWMKKRNNDRFYGYGLGVVSLKRLFFDRFDCISCICAWCNNVKMMNTWGENVLHEVLYTYIFINNIFLFSFYVFYIIYKKPVILM